MFAFIWDNLFFFFMGFLVMLPFFGVGKSITFLIAISVILLDIFLVGVWDILFYICAAFISPILVVPALVVDGAVTLFGLFIMITTIRMARVTARAINEDRMYKKKWKQEAREEAREEAKREAEQKKEAEARYGRSFKPVDPDASPKINLELYGLPASYRRKLDGTARPNDDWSMEDRAKGR